MAICRVWPSLALGRRVAHHGFKSASDGMGGLEVKGQAFTSGRTDNEKNNISRNHRIAAYGSLLQI